MERLRQEGKIGVPDWCKHIPSISRFGVSYDEIEKFVVPSFAEIAKIQKEAAGVPPYMSWNYIGNLAHPEWGETNTWEWFADKFGGGYRLLGGISGHGGLAYVAHDWSDLHLDHLGFRLRVAFPSKS